MIVCVCVCARVYSAISVPIEKCEKEVNYH